MPSHGIRHVVAKAKPKFRLVMLPEELMFKKFSWKKIQDFLRSLLLVSFVLFGCFFWFGLCVLSSKGRRMPYSLLWAPCSSKSTFADI